MSNLLEVGTENFAIKSIEPGSVIVDSLIYGVTLNQVQSLISSNPQFPTLLNNLPDAAFDNNKRAISLDASSSTATNVPTPSPSSTPNSGLNGGAIAGIVIGVIVGTVLLAMLGFYLYIRYGGPPKKSKSDEKDDLEMSAKE